MKMVLSILAVAMSLSSFAQVSYVSSIEVDLAHKGFKIDQAQVFQIPTRTEVRQIPGCNPGGEAENVCTEVVVIESQPVIQVFVDYSDGVFNDPEMPTSYLTFQVPVSEFSAEEVANLTAASPMWRMRGAATRRNFARNNFKLEMSVVNRDIRIVDTRRSKLCPIGESGFPQPGCVEELVYKTVSKRVRQVNLARN